MSIVKPLPKGDLERFVDIVANAYPGLGIDSDEDRHRTLVRLGKTYDRNNPCLFGLYREERLLGGMMLYDFTVNVHSFMIPAGGIGLVAVDLLHKKEKVAKEMMIYFLDHFRRLDVPLLMLYPFRPDFYKKMGFGFGTKANQYRILPAALPRTGNKESVRFLTSDDKDALLDCYGQYASVSHGAVSRMSWEVDTLFESEGVRVIGYEDDGELTGYLSFSFEKGETFLENDLNVNELIYTDRESFLGLMAFLQSQLDQVRRIVVNSFDDTFFFLLKDPRNDTGHVISPTHHEISTQGVGLMYRVIDIPGLFRSLSNHQFGNENCTLMVNIEDNFYPTNAGSTCIDFRNGKPVIVETDDFDVEINLDIAEFSSLIMSAVDFKSLHMYGLRRFQQLITWMSFIKSFIQRIDLFASPDSEWKNGLRAG